MKQETRSYFTFILVNSFGWFSGYHRKWYFAWLTPCANPLFYKFCSFNTRSSLLEIEYCRAGKIILSDNLKLNLCYCLQVFYNNFLPVNYLTLSYALLHILCYNCNKKDVSISIFYLHKINIKNKIPCHSNFKRKARANHKPTDSQRNDYKISYNVNRKPLVSFSYYDRYLNNASTKPYK